MKAQLEQANKMNEVCGGLRQLVSTKEKTIVEQRKIIDKYVISPLCADLSE